MTSSIRRLLQITSCLFLVTPWAWQNRSALAGTPTSGAQTLSFVEVLNDFPREDKNLRKWDAPVVADLDQDGWLDLILNDHGFGIRVCWNNAGRFAEPFDVIMGDLHGITVGDLDQVGNLEMVTSRGGGSGSNARNAKIFRVSREREFTDLPDYRAPLRSMRGRTVKLIDGDNDGDLDLLDFAFPSRETRDQSENYIYLNEGQGRLVPHGTLPPVKTNGQKTLVTDFNGDSIIDLILYGHGYAKAYQGLGDLTFEDVTDAVLHYRIEHVTGVVELDYDNDGDIDLFFTRGKDFEAGETFYDRNTLTWGFFTTRGPFQFEDLAVGDVLEIENYQAQWPNKQLLIGESAYEYEFPGETHSGRDIRIVSSDALGWPDAIAKKAATLGYVGNQAWRLAGDIWSPTTAVVHGVQSYPPFDHAPGLNDILLENKNGKFVDVTIRANLHVEDHTTGAAVADLDNNGYLDLLVIRRGDLIHANESLIFLNRGSAGFEQIARHGVVSPELGAIGLGAETLDYNQDGKMDILLGNERGKWHLFKNQGTSTPDANFIVVQVGSPEAVHATPLGAVVSVSAGENRYVRRVGSTGAMYSQSFNPYIHFGLGSWDGPVDVQVRWTCGETSERSLARVNQVVKLGDFPSP